MRVTNQFLPLGVSSSPQARTSFGAPTGVTQTRTPRRLEDVARFIEEFGTSNAQFLTRTAGVLEPGDRPKIQRGFIRRAVKRADNPLSGMVLRFMYNPETIERKYASYLDQAAIDPFNTVFQSGNLVAPPSIIEFNFELLFDRQQEATANGPWSSAADWKRYGVLHDLAFFDAVVRNVPPAGTPNTIPDNGVMMVNPEDIVVVFSQELTVQGKPINSRVVYKKFTNDMVPIRASVSITMIANYFGPLREPYGLDAAQKISQYKALISYDDKTDGIANARSVDAAIQEYRSSTSATSQFNSNLKRVSLASSQTTPWWQTDSTAPSAVGGTVGSTVTMVGPVNNSLAVAAMQVARSIAKSGVHQYSQPRRLSHGGATSPWYFDCSSFVWYAYSKVGGTAVFGSARYPATAGMLGYWVGSQWRTVQRVLSGKANMTPSQVANAAKPGDLLFEAPGHIAIVIGAQSGGLLTVAARSSSSSPQVGEKVESYSYIQGKYDILLRPALVGSQSVVGRL